MSAVSQFPPAHLIADESSEGDAGDRTGDGAATNEDRTPLALPAPDEEQQPRSQPEREGRTAKDELSGLAARFDALGPMVINSNGTLSRIHNWASMTAAEQANTARVINARNQARLKVLRDKEATEEAATEQGTTTTAKHAV